MSLDSRTRLYGVLGDPVEHSLSPLLHNAAIRKLGLNAVYLAFHVRPEALCLAFEGIRSMDLGGVNLTIPFKEVALDFIDEVPEDLDRIVGAINTVVNRNGQLLGYNTDGPGFLTALQEELSFKPEGKTALVLGAGGAARGVLFSLARAHAERIFVLNRTKERAEGLVKFSSTHFPETELESVLSFDELRSQKIDLVVNATSCGMRGNTELPFELKQLKNAATVYDLVYSPLETPLLKSARALGWSCANGLGMLVAQAALSFALWTGKKEGVREAMREALKTCSM